MSKYTAIPCPVCGKPFTEQDNIVVCPECGAPHHRDCYTELGGCVFESKHAEGFVWQLPTAAQEVIPQATPTTNYVPPLSTPNRMDSPDYGHRYGENSPPPRRELTPEGMPEAFRIRIDEEIDGVSVKDYAQFIGPNSFYYLLRFKVMARTGQSVVLNFSAMVFGFYYYFNRKMYKLGVAMLAMFLLCAAPVLLVTYYYFPDFLAALPAMAAGVTTAVPDMSAHTGLLLFSRLMNFIYFGACLMSGLFANGLYYRHAKREVLALRTRFVGRPDDELSHALAIRGRTSKVTVVAVISLLVLGYIAYNMLIGMAYSNLIQ